MTEQLLVLHRWKQDRSGVVGAAAMLVFAGIAVWRWSSTGLLFFALAALRDVLAAWYFLNRGTARSVGGRGAALLAYASSGLPLFYLGGDRLVVVSNVLSILGYALATLALIDLGKSFGVSPADRGRVQSGVYRILRHPMYLGYVISEMGLVAMNPDNIGIFFVSTTFYVIRMRLEDRVL